jgi:protein-disulfide isomerase
MGRIRRGRTTSHRGLAGEGPGGRAITIVEFADYQCPFCARSEGLIDQALAAYPKQARFTTSTSPDFQSSAGAPALAAGRAEAGKFWEMHEILFANQQALSNEQIEQYAHKIGLDMARFKKDIDSER